MKKRKKKAKKKRETKTRKTRKPRKTRKTRKTRKPRKKRPFSTNFSNKGMTSLFWGLVMSKYFEKIWNIISFAISNENPHSLPLPLLFDPLLFHPPSSCFLLLPLPSTSFLFLPLLPPEIVKKDTISGNISTVVDENVHHFDASRGEYDFLYTLLVFSSFFLLLLSPIRFSSMHSSLL